MNSWPSDPYSWYSQPNPNVYVPPPQAFHRDATGYWDQSWADATNPHHFGHTYHSRNYPSINPLLATDTALQWDVRRPPRDAIRSSDLRSNLATVAPAVVGSTDLRLVSKTIPWTIDILPPHRTTITCKVVWKAIYAALQEPLADSEWGLIVGDRRQRTRVERAAQRRQDAGDPVSKLKRIDWLGETTMFNGLERDEDFVKRRILPGDDSYAETWVVKFASG